MAISKEKKDDLVARYTDMLRECQGVIVTEYRGMTMAQFNGLRAKMRDVGSTYMVTKNTLLKIALKNMGMAVPDDLLAGPVAVAFAHKDLAATAKAVLDYRKDVNLFLVKGGLAGLAIFPDEGQVEQLSKLPPLDELRAHILGLVIAPAQGLLALLTTPTAELVSVINGGATQLLNVVAAYANKQEEGAA